MDLNNHSIKQKIESDRRKSEKEIKIIHKIHNANYVPRRMLDLEKIK